MVSNFCSTFSWYGKSRAADIETGPQPFITSYPALQDGEQFTVRTKTILFIKKVIGFSKLRKRKLEKEIYQGIKIIGIIRLFYIINKG